MQFFFILLLRLVSKAPGRRTLRGAGSKRPDRSGYVLGFGDRRCSESGPGEDGEAIAEVREVLDRGYSFNNVTLILLFWLVLSYFC